MKSKLAIITGNADWDFPRRWLSNNRIRGKYFWGIFKKPFQKNDKSKFTTFRLTRVLNEKNFN